MNRWWAKEPDERYWLESTDRDDLGADLNAPLYDDSGKENWRYTLLREVAVGDVVFHYDKNHQAIVAVSEVASEAVEDTVVWAARGTYARQKGTSPHARPGLRVALANFRLLEEPIDLDVIRAKAAELRSAKSSLEKRFGAPLYLPFELSEKRPLRLLQGYAFKLAHDYVRVLGLEEGGDPGRRLPEQVPDSGAFSEGAVRKVTVNAFERNPAARTACLAHWGYDCAVCGFNFQERYGDLGKDYIHVHHLVPLASIGAEYIVDPVEDLRPVCPNCHSMLHRVDPPLEIDELKARLR